MITSNLWDLGGYVPFAYKITPWNELFPDLAKFNKLSSIENIFIGKLYIYYLTRLQFLQYLNFLCDVGAEICENNSLDYDVMYFKEYCLDLIEIITKKVKNEKEKKNEDLFMEIVKNFREKIFTSDCFFSKKVYQFFFENYLLFANYSYGFIMCSFYENGMKFYTIDGVDPLTTFYNSKRVPQPFSLLPMLEDAMRYYPVITCSGRLHLCLFSAIPTDGWGSMRNTEKWFSINSIRLDENKFEYIPSFQNENDRLYGVGSKNIPLAFNGKIRGFPMFLELPFDIVNNFVVPDDPANTR